MNRILVLKINIDDYVKCNDQVVNHHPVNSGYNDNIHF